MRALAATLLSACAAVRGAAPISSISAVVPSAPVASSAPPSAPAPAGDRPSGTPDPADNPEPDTESAGAAAAQARLRHDHIREEEAAALRGLTVDQAKQWLAARGYHGELQVFDGKPGEFNDTSCAVDTVCDWEPRDFDVAMTLQITINKTKFEIAPPPGGQP